VKYNDQEDIQHRGDIVTEGSSSKDYAIKAGEIYTHPVNNYILNGITRMVIKDIDQEKDIHYNEGTFTEDFLRNADEIIVSSTSIEIIQVVKLDGEQVGEREVGPITKSLQELSNRYIDTDS